MSLLVSHINWRVTLVAKGAAAERISKCTGGACGLSDSFYGPLFRMWIHAVSSMEFTCPRIRERWIGRSRAGDPFSMWVNDAGVIEESYLGESAQSAAQCQVPSGFRGNQGMELPFNNYDCILSPYVLGRRPLGDVYGDQCLRGRVAHEALHLALRKVAFMQPALSPGMATMADWARDFSGGKDGDKKEEDRVNEITTQCIGC